MGVAGGEDRLRPGQRVKAVAPVRVCDVGGWTDTWFGSPGQVCSIAVGPAVTVEVAAIEATGDLAGTVHVAAPDVGLDSVVDPRDPAALVGHPLLAHGIAAGLSGLAPTAGVQLEVTISSAVPPGASLGTSASVVTALLAALDATVRRSRGPAALAAAAHEVETTRAGREAGVQDQWSAAHGGVAHMRIGPYPDVAHTPIPVTPATTSALADRLVTVAFGAHDSSTVHREVITAITACGGEDHERTRAAFATLATLAGRAAEALSAGDLDRWAEVLCESTTAQQELHPGLVGEHHRAAIDVARAAGAVGWKVNGAGGAGGSLTVLTASGQDRSAIEAALTARDGSWRILDLGPAGGVTVERVD